MDSRLKADIDEIRSLASNEASDWIINKYPIDCDNYGQAFQIIGHRSWKKGDQIKLARYYLNKMPFANRQPYETFLSFMSVESFIGVVKECVPDNDQDVDLLAYHLKPAMRKAAKDDRSKEVVDKFFSELT